jgi:hypothetical protein
MGLNNEDLITYPRIGILAAFLPARKYGKRRKYSCPVDMSG